MDRFPDARPVAHASLQPILAEVGPPMFKQLNANMGPGLADRAVIPETLEEDKNTLEGARIDLLGPRHGDTSVITPLYIESLDTLITSDIAFADTHAFVVENTEPEALALWRESLDQLEAVSASTIVPGHRMATSANDASAFTRTRHYLDGWEAAMAEAADAESLRAGLDQPRWGSACSLLRGSCGGRSLRLRNTVGEEHKPLFLLRNMREPPTQYWRIHPKICSTHHRHCSKGAQPGLRCHKALTIRSNLGLRATGQSAKLRI